MKRLMFIFMIIVVLGVIGFYAFMEFSLPEIDYVKDYFTVSTKGNEMVARRLYTSGVDLDSFTTEIENNLITAEFTEEEIVEAAATAGKPEFYPAFYFNTYLPDPKTETYNFTGIIRQEIAPGQTDAHFEITNLYLEMYSPNLKIKNVEVTSGGKADKAVSIPIISEDEYSMVIPLDAASAISLQLEGTSGTVTFQYTYDIKSNTILPSTVLTKRLMMVHANISYTSEDGLIVEYIPEPYYSLEEYEDYE